MSFDINNWGRWSVSYNSFPPNEWAYSGIKNGQTDTVSDIMASGYFPDEMSASFLEVGHLIYIVGEPTVPIEPSRVLLVVTGLKPTTVQLLEGSRPLMVAKHTISATVDQVLTIQAFPIPGVNVTDIVMVNVRNSTGASRIIGANTGVDVVAIEWDAAPGVNFNIDILVFVPSFI